MRVMTCVPEVNVGVMDGVFVAVMVDMGVSVRAGWVGISVQPIKRKNRQKRMIPRFIDVSILN